MAASKTRSGSKSKGSALSRVGKKGTTKSKSNTPQITITDQEQLQALKEIVDAKIAVKAAESAKKIAEGAFLDEATDLYESKCRNDGTLHTSVRFLGTLDMDGQKESLSLQFLQTRRCKKMVEDEASDPLHSAFGNDFDDLFNPQRTIEIDTSKLTDEQVDAVVEKLEEALGDNFDDAVSVEALILPKEAFFGKRILDANIRAKAQNAAADGYAVPFAPAFKL